VLSTLASRFGAAHIEHAFNRFDDNGSGQLDAVEFERMAAANGFGVGARAIFRELDDDFSGHVSVRELLSTLKARQQGLSPAQQLALSTVWAPDETAHAPSKLDTRSWRITAKDVAGVRAQLTALVDGSGASVADMMRLFDRDVSAEILIDDGEFLTAMRDHCGFKGNPLLLHDVFRSIDDNDSGQIGFNEMFEFLRGYRHSLDQRTKPVPACMPIVPPPDATWELEDVAWDVETLRDLMAAALAKYEVGSATELLAAWDSDGDRSLNSQEFVHKVRTPFAHAPFAPHASRRDVLGAPFHTRPLRRRLVSTYCVYC
jgi:Ca2+-binding EF-hand superfamily protein